MSLFTKTVVVQGGMSRPEVKAWEQVFEKLGERLRGLDAEILELREEIAALKREPRQSLQAKLRARGHS